MNAKSPPKNTSRINDLNNVIDKARVPFPIAWKRFPESTPKGISNIKKHNIWSASIMLEDKTELLAEYENINDKGSAKIKNDNEIITDEIIASLIP